jgi:hypothetical protein
MTRTSAGRARSDADLDLVELVLVDGDNLLHAVRGTRDAGGVAWLLPRLRAWRPPDVTVIVALDGPADRGLGDQRPIAPGISVRHAGTRSADDVIVTIVEARPYADRARTVVVTDDAGLRERVRRAGGIGRRTTWLTGQMARAVAASTSDPRPAPPDPRPGSSIGSGRAPARGTHRGPPGREDEDERPWQPGRGATKKSGNPRRATRKSGDPRR